MVFEALFGGDGGADENLEPIDGLGLTMSGRQGHGDLPLPAGGALISAGRRELRTAAQVVVLSALAGLPVGLLWRAVAPLPRIIKRADGLYRAGGEGNEAAIAADGWFALLALLAGVLIALVVYLRTRPGRVVPLFALAAGGLLGAVVAWRVGVLLESRPDRGDGARAGRRVAVRRPARGLGLRRAARLADGRGDHLLRGLGRRRGGRDVAGRGRGSGQPTRRSGAVRAPVTRNRSAGASRTCRPRRPAET